MPESVLPTHEAILQLCAGAAPNPWHPKQYAADSGVPRAALDPILNELRLHGLIRLTDWDRKTGQGYLLTDFGKDLMKSPSALAQLRDNLAAGLRPPSMLEPTRAEVVPTPLERGDAAREALHAPGQSRLVSLIIFLNIILFVLSYSVALREGVPSWRFLLRGDYAVLHQVGALTQSDLLRGEWWRLLTASFLHYGVLHLVLNMFALHTLRMMESAWGPLRFLLIYLGSAIGGTCVSMIYHSPLQPIVLAGASIAIWGLMGSLVAWIYMNRSHLTKEDLRFWTNMLVVAFIINVGISFVPMVDSAGHFGGGAVGFILGSLLHVQRYAIGRRRVAATALAALLPFLCLLALRDKMNTDERWILLARMTQGQASPKRIAPQKNDEAGPESPKVDPPKADPSEENRDPS